MVREDEGGLSSTKTIVKKFESWPVAVRRGDPFLHLLGAETGWRRRWGALREVVLSGWATSPPEGEHGWL